MDARARFVERLSGRNGGALAAAKQRQSPPLPPYSTTRNCSYFPSGIT
jgi:hypothetical protein